MVIKFLLASLALLEKPGLHPNPVLIEDAANGPAVCQFPRRKVPWLIAIPPWDGKASRAHTVAPLVEADQLRLAPHGLLPGGGAAGWPSLSVANWTTRWTLSAKGCSGSRPSSGETRARAARRYRWFSPAERGLTRSHGPCEPLPAALRRYRPLNPFAAANALAVQLRNEVQHFLQDLGFLFKLPAG